jgi:tetratricopeptide (TPR) repeat protein
MYRLESWQGADGYAELAVKAMEWFHRVIELNRYDPYSSMRIGMCYHWLGRHAEAAPWFERARRLDPNGYYLLAHLGWHKVQLDDYDAAYKLFHRSLQLTPHGTTNTIAHAYLGVISDQRLRQPFPALPKPVPKP